MWLTWIDPNPARDGQRIYSGGLIHAFAAAGARMDVLCFGDAQAQHPAIDSDQDVRWWRVPESPNPALASLASPLPNVAFRADTAAMRSSLDHLLRTHRWHAVIFDGLYSGYALAPVLARFGGDRRRPQFIYVSHNHEETVRADMARNATGGRLRKAVLHLDARKARRLERSMVDAADIVTAITPDDSTRFCARRPDKRIVVLPPGYDGPRRERRRITASVPRRAVVMGTFDWLAKRMNLLEFLEVADPLFAEAQAGLQIVGHGDPSFVGVMKRRFANTTVLGAVPDISPYLDSARIAIVPERTGGGFKLKTLDYVFHRLPIAALDKAVAGTPLAPDDSILTFPSQRDLAEGSIRAIDNLELLNSLQERAYAACANRFDWRSRGDQLLKAVAS